MDTIRKKTEIFNKYEGENRIIYTFPYLRIRGILNNTHVHVSTDDHKYLFTLCILSISYLS